MYLLCTKNAYVLSNSWSNFTAFVILNLTIPYILKWRECVLKRRKYVLMICLRAAILDFHNLFWLYPPGNFMMPIAVLGNMRHCLWLCNDFMQRFIPAEFGADPTKVQICDMDYGFYEKKIEIRHSIESEGIPHTYICCNFFMRYLLPSLVQPGLDAPPRDEIKIFGEGNTKGW